MQPGSSERSLMPNQTCHLFHRQPSLKHCVTCNRFNPTFRVRCIKMCIWEVNNNFSFFPLSSPSAHSEMSCQMVNFGHFEHYAQWSERGGVGRFFQIFVYAFFSFISSFYKEKRSFYEPKIVKFYFFFELKNAKFGVYKGILTVSCYLTRPFSPRLILLRNMSVTFLKAIEDRRTWGFMAEMHFQAHFCTSFMTNMNTPPDPQSRTTVHE